MYRLIEVKQKKLSTSQITLAEVEAFARRTWNLENLDHMSELGLVIAIDLADHVRELNALQDESDALRDANDSLVARTARARQTANRIEADARREQEETEYRDSQRERIMHDLERARTWGNEYEESKALERLRHL